MSHNEEFQRRRIEDRRLVILRYLDEEPDGRMSVSLMMDGLELMTHRVPRATVMEDAGYLEGLGLLRVEYVGSVPMLRITGRGTDVAQGRANAPGVKRPARK
mgnify:FL=1